VAVSRKQRLSGTLELLWGRRPPTGVPLCPVPLPLLLPPSPAAGHATASVLLSFCLSAEASGLLLLCLLPLLSRSAPACCCCRRLFAASSAMPLLLLSYCSCCSVAPAAPAPAPAAIPLVMAAALPPIPAANKNGWQEEKPEGESTVSS